MTDAPGPLPAGQDRAALLDAVTAGLAHLRRGVSVVVACSAGPDSTALAFLAAEARPDLRLTLVHVRHGLRDDADDAELARQHADWLGIDHRELVVEVVRRGEGPEADARRARYTALREVAAELRAATILLGHTADDQAETLLLRLARGTGVDGLAGMAAVTDDLTRPLLRLRRDDVRGFVAQEGVPCVDDPTNRDPAVRRAVVRHQVLPSLAGAGPDPVGALCRLAEHARDDAASLAASSRPLLDQVLWVGEAASLPAATLTAAPRALAARVVREVLGLFGGRPPSAAVVARVLGEAGSARGGGRARATSTPADTALAGTEGSGSLPEGVELTRTPGWWTLAPREPASSAAVTVPDRGEVVWEPAGRVLRVLAPGGEQARDARGQLPLELPGAWSPPAVRIPAGAVAPGTVAERLTLAVPDGCDGLVMRHREPGDRIMTPAGTKRVARAMSEAGLPAPLRDLWPVVALADRVVWVPGIAADRQVLVGGRSSPTRLLLLELAAGRSVTDAARLRASRSRPCTRREAR